MDRNQAHGQLASRPSAIFSVLIKSRQSFLLWRPSGQTGAIGICPNVNVSCPRASEPRCVVAQPGTNTTPTESTVNYRRKDLLAGHCPRETEYTNYV